MLEAQIAQLEEKLGAAPVIDADEISTDVVQIGSIVHVKDEKTGKSQKFTIVGSAEANPAEQQLSNESPVGKALIGHKRNEIVSVQVPSGPRASSRSRRSTSGSDSAPARSSGGLGAAAGSAPRATCAMMRRA